jgi:subtilase family serine protease
MFRRRPARPSIDRLEERCLLSAFGPPAGGLTPAQLTHAYGLDSITFGTSGPAIKADGSGQTIAIVDPYHNPNLGSDLHTFDQWFGLPDPSLGQVNLAGNRTDDAWASEESMDVEWAHAIAPAARIVVVEARSADTPSLIAAVNTARQLPGVSVVSLSWGGNEMRNERALDRSFTTPPGHTGITFVASSGDTGLRGGAQWPATSPNVLAVGGTTLSVDAAGNYRGETAWSNSGGGRSAIEPQPAYQLGLSARGRRSTPDVAFDANPTTGVDVYATAPSDGQGAWVKVGGTSLGAPAWAGTIALADQGRSLAGMGTLDGPNQTLPILYRLPARDFHAVAGAFTRRGAPVATGRGSPNGAALVYGLAYG